MVRRTSAIVSAMHDAAQRILEEAGGPADVTITGPEATLPSAFDVTGLAAGTIAAATSAAADLVAVRTGGARGVVAVDTVHAAAAFRSEANLRTDGWDVPSPWDPIAGDYLAADGWIRLHTNYAHHRAAVEAVLGDVPDRAATAALVAMWKADELEVAVVAAGGAAAAERTLDEWATHPAGVAVAAEPLIARSPLGTGSPRAALAAGGPLRVLDLTRVIAGPVAGRFLAAHGAEVLRLDPPGFEEVPALVVETTAGKRRAFLDLRSTEGRAAFEELLAGADVLLCGYRADALDRLGFPEERLAEIAPHLVVGRLDAYGWTGPWSGRRGFDSLVQMSTGIAARGRAVAGLEPDQAPRPLPAQALDHGTGYLLAAAVQQAIAALLRGESGPELVRCSLARTARALVDLGETGDLAAAALTPDQITPLLDDHDTTWGGLQLVSVPGTIDGRRPVPATPPGPLGADAPTW